MIKDNITESSTICLCLIIECQINNSWAFLFSLLKARVLRKLRQIKGCLIIAIRFCSKFDEVK